MKPLRRINGYPRYIRWNFERAAPEPYTADLSPVADMWTRIMAERQRALMATLPGFQPLRVTAVPHITAK